MASVYAAEDDVLGRPVAVKVLAEALAADEAARGRFTREARAAARVSDHPHVVTIYDVGETEADPPLAFIVMELLPGGTVADRLRSGEPIPHGVALKWLEQAATALDAAHAADIVHRDDKPANLLLDSNGLLKVGDFGIATLGTEAPLTMTGQVVGTAAYFSPEQALGHPATSASDRYALAVVAFELLTGRRPFAEGPAAAQARAHIDADRPRATVYAPGLPPHVDAVLARGMAKDPGERPPTATALVGELEKAIGPTAATEVAPTARFTRPAPLPPPGPEPVRSHTSSGRLARPLALAALILGLGILLAVVLASGGGDDAKPRAQRTAKTSPQARSTPKPASTPTAAAPTPPPDKTAIQRQAHTLIDQGRYPEAIGMLRDLVNDCPVQTTDPCAFAWYDLGHALRLSGDPAGAIPVLQTRLQNPDQHEVVQKELELAKKEARAAEHPKKAHGKKD
jgi:serine/threonine-protein kinase